MARHAHAHALLVVIMGLVPASACGRVTPEAKDEQARRIENPEELEQLDEAEQAKRAKQAKRFGPPRWKRKPPPMPETFVAFELPDLASLDGVWLVESEIPNRRVLWLIEEAGVKLTEIDDRGHERIYGMTLASPCALRLTDEHGHARTRMLARRGDQLVVSHRGAAAVVGRDGSMLACVGHRTYQIAADGRCRYTTEMLGAWTEPAEPDGTCKLGSDEQGPVLTIGERQLRERDGLWLDELAMAARATRLDSREAGLAVLAGDAATADTAEPTSG